MRTRSPLPPLLLFSVSLLGLVYCCLAPIGYGDRKARRAVKLPGFSVTRYSPAPLCYPAAMFGHDKRDHPDLLTDLQPPPVSAGTRELYCQGCGRMYIAGPIEPHFWLGCRECRGKWQRKDQVQSGRPETL